MLKKLSYFVLVLSCLTPASAYAVDVVRSPFVHGEDFQFDYKEKYQYDDTPALNAVQETDVGFGYGFTEWWRSRIEGEFTDQNNDGMRFKYVGMANTISLTGTNSSLPTALFTNIVFANHNYIANYITAGLATAKDTGPITHTANLLLKHEFGETASGKPSLLYRYQAKYNAYSYAQPGFELFGDTYKQDHFDRQTLKIGPGLFGTVQLGAERVGYELAFLVGATTASPDGTLQWRLFYALP